MTKNVQPAITVAVAATLLLIVTGIWNAQRTADIAESNIRSSIQSRKLSNDLRVYQAEMDSSLEYALQLGDASTQVNFENSHKKLQETIYATSELVDDPVMKQIQSTLSDVIIHERKIYSLLRDGDLMMSFNLIASDDYQDHKIRQEQLGFTLRAILDQRSSDVIQELKQSLSRTIFALAAQMVLLFVIWAYVVRVIRQWHREHDKHNQELANLALYDPLTGIGNRTLFQRELQEAFAEAKETGQFVGLLLLDLDHFKDINDNMGHEVGDLLLIHVAEALTQCCRAQDTVARLGGDEFAIIAKDLDSKSDTTLLCQRILQIFDAPITLKTNEVTSKTSIGAAFYPSDTEKADELLRKADMALYEAKRNGRAHYAFFNKKIETRARTKIELLEDLSNALENNEFQLLYQPIFDLASETITGTECLLRWQHPRRGLVPPDMFIPLAEESRLIIDIGRWVLQEACAQQVAWENAGLRHMNMAVNLSAVQFNESDIFDVIENTISSTGIAREQLTLEITESTIMESDIDIVERLTKLNELGINLAIDDFGTGYSSLGYLKRFPIQHLKIDRTFVKELPDNPHDIAISRSIITMAHELGLKVIAEGIENPEQLKFLKATKCNLGQGYYFGRPASASSILEKFEKPRLSTANVANFSRAQPLLKP